MSPIEPTPGHTTKSLDATALMHDMYILLSASLTEDSMSTHDSIENLKSLAVGLAVVDKADPSNAREQVFFASYLTNALEHQQPLDFEQIRNFFSKSFKDGVFDNESFGKILKKPMPSLSNLGKLYQGMYEAGVNLPADSLALNIPDDSTPIDTKIFKQLQELVTASKENNKFSYQTLLKVLDVNNPKSKFATLFSTAEIIEIINGKENFNLDNLVANKIANSASISDIKKDSLAQRGKDVIMSGINWTPWIIPAALWAPIKIVLEGTAIADDVMHQRPLRNDINGRKLSAIKDSQEAADLYAITGDNEKSHSSPKERDSSKITTDVLRKLDLNDPKSENHLKNIHGIYDINPDGTKTKTKLSANAEIVLEEHKKVYVPFLTMYENLLTSNRTDLEKTQEIWGKFINSIPGEAKKEINAQIPHPKEDDRSDPPYDGEPSKLYTMLMSDSARYKIELILEFSKQQEIFKGLKGSANAQIEQHVFNLVRANPTSELSELCKHLLNVGHDVTFEACEQAITKYRGKASDETLERFIPALKELNSLPSLTHELIEFDKPNVEINAGSLEAKLEEFAGSLGKTEYKKYLECFNQARAKMKASVDVGTPPPVDLTKLKEDYYKALENAGLPKEPGKTAFEGQNASSDKNSFAGKNALAGNNASNKEDNDSIKAVSLYDDYVRYIASEGSLGIGLDALLDWLIKNMINGLFLGIDHHVATSLVPRMAKKMIREDIKAAQIKVSAAKNNLINCIETFRDDPEKLSEDDINNMIRKINTTNYVAKDFVKFYHNCSDIQKAKIKPASNKLAEALGDSSAAKAQSLAREKALCLSLARAGNNSYFLQERVAKINKELGSVGAIPEVKPGTALVTANKNELAEQNAVQARVAVEQAIIKNNNDSEHNTKLKTNSNSNSKPNPNKG